MLVFRETTTVQKVTRRRSGWLVANQVQPPPAFVPVRGRQPGPAEAEDEGRPHRLRTAPWLTSRIAVGMIFQASYLNQGLVGAIRYDSGTAYVWTGAAWQALL